MNLKDKTFNPQGGFRVVTKCPACGKGGTFDELRVQNANVSDISTGGDRNVLGQRTCPNPACRLHVFFIGELDGGEILRLYPALRIDFDSSNIPDPITKLLNEAIICHAEECYTAAAITVRRTLEELCKDRSASGKSLKQRIQSLESEIILPKQLFDAMTDLRLLGNDAAHVKAKVYDDIGKEEVEAAIDVTKEILKAVFQLDDLVDRLRSLAREEATAEDEES